MISGIYNGDFRECVSMISDDCIDIAIYSPPYKDCDGYTENLIRDSYREILRILKKGSLCFVNFGHLAEDKFRPFKVALMGEEVGFKAAETFIWKKNHYRPIQGNKRVNNLTEFVFMFYKDKMPDLDRLALGIPYVDKSNAKRFSKGRDLKCRGNFWDIPYDTIQKSSQKLHNDRMPIGLPRNCLRLSGLKTGIVIDPFCGSGTVGCAAKELGLDFIGFDVSKVHCETAKKRIEAYEVV